jgi:ABC-type multidrug transport system fused ATPase/permease subunit
MVRNTTFLANDLATNVMLSFFILFQSFFSIAFLVILLAVVNPIVIGGAVIYFGLGFFLYAQYVMPRARAAGKEGMDLWRQILQSMQEGFRGVKALQASNSVDVVGRDHARRRQEFASYRYRMSVYSQMPSYYLQAVMIGGVVLFIAVVIGLHTSNVAALIGIIIASFLRLLPSLYQALSSLGKIRGSHANVETIFSELNRMEDDPHQISRGQRRGVSTPTPPMPLQWNDSLRFQNVVFRYPGSNLAALDDVSFAIPKGSFVGIVGPSGAGKTTIVDMMLGLFEAADGCIKVDDTVLSGPSTIEAWRRSVGYVPQDVFLLDSSVRENIVFGTPNFEGDAAIWEALASAQIAELVESMPDKLDTVLGEHGVRVSGGQRQRFGIARALFRKPAILILDEATSALDTATEAALAVTVRNLEVVNLTRIAVAHRLSTVRECDTLFLFDSGKLVGEGDFDSLREDNQ